VAPGLLSTFNRSYGNWDWFSIFWDVNFGTVEKVFDSSGQLLDQAYVRRTDKFLNELIWMAKVLRYGRENISLE